MIAIWYFSLQHFLVVEEVQAQRDKVTQSRSWFLSGRAGIWAWIYQCLKPHWADFQKRLLAQRLRERCWQQDNTQETRGREESKAQWKALSQQHGDSGFIQSIRVSGHRLCPQTPLSQHGVWGGPLYPKKGTDLGIDTFSLPSIHSTNTY